MANNFDALYEDHDSLAVLSLRRKNGKFFTNNRAAELCNAKIKQLVHPTFIFEPFVGAGALIGDFIPECKGIANDIDTQQIERLSNGCKMHELRVWKFFSRNILTTSIDELDNWISLTENDVFLIYTNPPYGTCSTNSLVSKAEEIGKDTSRTIPIDYGCDTQEEKLIKTTYGSGDLVLPSIGKLIELIKRKGKGHLAFFSPSGVFLGRARYKKLFAALLKHFDFVYGEIFSGKEFEKVSKQKAIAFTIWRYHENANTEPSALKFMFEGTEYQLKKLPLLKNGWKYDERERQCDEIMVQHCETFNSAPPKMFHIQPSKGGSELIQKNVKVPLNVPNLCDPLLYGLWSVTVGYRSIITPPIVFDNCYVHLPDFSNREVQEILALSALFHIIAQMINNYCQNKIGFLGPSGTLVFGGIELTKDMEYLFHMFGSIQIDETRSLRDVLEYLRKERNLAAWDYGLRKVIREQIRIRLEHIGYWKYLPIP